jgi:hypothetical protein
LGYLITVSNKKYIIGLAIESNNSHPIHISVGHGIIFGAIIKQGTNNHFQFEDLFDWIGGIKNKTFWTFSFNPALDERSRGYFSNNDPKDYERIERIVMNSLVTKFPFDEFVTFEITPEDFIVNFIGISNQKPLIQTNSDLYTYDLIRENCIKFAVTEFQRITGLTFKHSTEVLGNTLYLPNTLLNSLRHYNFQLKNSSQIHALIPHLSDDSLNRYIFGENDWDEKFSKL